MRRGIRGGVSSGQLYLSQLGTSLLHHWRVPDDRNPSVIDIVTASPPVYPTEAVDGLIDLAGSADAAQVGATGTGPLYFDYGGPMGRAHMECTARRMSATLSIPADNRVALYGILAADTLDGARTLLEMRGVGNVMTFGQLAMVAPEIKWRHSCNFNDGTDFADVPDRHTDWMLYAGCPFATGGRFSFDGVETSPNWTSTDDLPAATILYFGSSGGTSLGWFKEAWIVDNITAAKHALCVAYGAQEIHGG